LLFDFYPKKTVSSLFRVICLQKKAHSLLPDVMIIFSSRSSAKSSMGNNKVCSTGNNAGDKEEDTGDTVADTADTVAGMAGTGDTVAGTEEDTGDKGAGTDVRVHYPDCRIHRVHPDCQIRPDYQFLRHLCRQKNLDILRYCKKT
jgi:hypothetical protein